MYQVFIDGSAGTTGLKIGERLSQRNDVSLIKLPEAFRKDLSARKDAINQADVVFLCLPDEAAREAVTLIENSNTIIIDASTAHRTAEGWAYGFAELSPEHRNAIASSKRIANPGCYASGFISLVYPLVKNGLASADYPFVCHAVSGYSGAGKKGIEQYTAADRAIALESPRLYGLTLSHKHLPEMQKVCGLSHKPIFNPYICDYERGMTVSVPIYVSMLTRNVTPIELEKMYCEHYKGSNFVSVEREESGFLAANAVNGTNRLQIFVNGNEEQILLTARLDNLGKGASGAAIQNMNLALGLDERIGL